jgi:hypothetical protein
MGDVKLSSPRVTVIREGHDTLEIQTANPDLVLWDRTRIKHKWPGFQEAPFLWLTFIAWAAARRTGAIPMDLRYEAWEETVLQVVDTEQDDTTVSEIGSPTRPGVEPG